MRRFFLWCRSVFMRGRLEREMREEMSQHISQATSRNIARGMSARDAAKAAEREFGNVAYLQEQARDARGQRWIDALTGDVRFALRHFRRTPLTTVTMIVVLSFGIGVNTALFTAFHSMWSLPGPGIPHDDALARIRGVDVTLASGEYRLRLLPFPEVTQYMAQQSVFASVAATTRNAGVLRRTELQATPASADVVYVSDNYFDLLKVRPALGRWLGASSSADASTALTAMISHHTWVAMFDSLPDVIGRTFEINGIPVTITAVAPRGFAGTREISHPFAAWLPLGAYTTLERTGPSVFASPDSARFFAFARLTAGVTHAAAEPAAKAIAARAAAARTEQVGAPVPVIATADVVPLRAMNDNPDLDEPMRQVGTVLGMLTLLVLLVTCTNVSSLLVGAAVARRREIAVRLSMGAARRRIIRQLLTESVLLAVAAGALGMLIMWTVLKVVNQRVPAQYFGDYVRFDWQGFVFTFGFAIATGVLFGLSPALHGTRMALAETLKNTASAVSHSRAWPQRALVVAQITLTQPLLVGVFAMVMLGSEEIRNARTSAADAETLFMTLDTHAGSAPVARKHADLARVQQRLAGLPGVAGAAPESEEYYRVLSVHPDDRTESGQQSDAIDVRTKPTTPGYLAVRDVPVLLGRDFSKMDVDSVSSAVIIGDRFARDLFGGESPLGRRVQIQGEPHYRTIVGVVDEDASDAVRTTRPSQPLVYAVSTIDMLPDQLVVRTRGPALPLMPALRQAVAAEATHLPLGEMETKQMQRDELRRLQLRTFSGVGIGGLLTLLLSAIGLYAVVAFAVSQRTREIGIRTALGARRNQIVGLFFSTGLRLSLFGLLLGLPLGLIVFRFMLDLITAGTGQIKSVPIALSVAVGVLVVAAIATWVPARRAAAVDPLISLRAE